MSLIAARRAAALGSAALAASMLLASAPAHAGTQQAKHTFKMSAPYYKKTDSNGTFTGQVNMAGTVGKPATMAWSFRTSPKVQAIATGRMTCKAGHMQLPYHDSHANVPVDYFWHSSVKNNRRNKDYTLWGNCTFRVKVGGKTGTANLGFRFNYALFDGISRSAAADQPTGDTAPAPGKDGEFGTDLKITYDS
ncbi:hypothetical protein [Streptomyces sp. enrichment culture]|uniref:hypothetical protein n=1 Tax=Streptomyces sp. enrichment culture TaxID=1795815 RepID=UPI003F57BFCA